MIFNLKMVYFTTLSEYLPKLLKKHYIFGYFNLICGIIHQNLSFLRLFNRIVFIFKVIYIVFFYVFELKRVYFAVFLAILAKILL